MESTTITKKFTFTAVRESDTLLENRAFTNETSFLRNVCECLAQGFKILYAAELTIQDDSVIGIIRLKKYISE